MTIRVAPLDGCMITHCVVNSDSHLRYYYSCNDSILTIPQFHASTWSNLSLVLDVFGRTVDVIALRPGKGLGEAYFSE